MIEGAKFRKKPVEVEAIKWVPCESVLNQLCDFLGGKITTDKNNRIEIETLEGNIYASPGDWVIKGIKGEFYPCKPDIFEATYDPVL